MKEIVTWGMPETVNRHPASHQRMDGKVNAWEMIFHLQKIPLQPAPLVFGVYKAASTAYHTDIFRRGKFLLRSPCRRSNPFGCTESWTRHPGCEFKMHHFLNTFKHHMVESCLISVYMYTSIHVLMHHAFIYIYVYDMYICRCICNMVHRHTNTHAHVCHQRRNLPLEPCNTPALGADEVSRRWSGRDKGRGGHGRSLEDLPGGTKSMNR